MLIRVADLSRSRFLQTLLRTSGRCLDALLSRTRLKILLRNVRKTRSIQLLRRAGAAIAMIAFLWLFWSFWDGSDRTIQTSSFVLPDDLVKGKCEGRRVFMYDLPREFNVRILERCFGELVYWLNFCPHVLNNGLGQLLDFTALPPNSSLFSAFFARQVSPSSAYTDSKSNVWNPGGIRASDLDGRGSCVIDKGGSWFGTDAYMLEEIYHSRMLHYPCLTTDPGQASAFFLPYYTGLAALEYLYGAKRAQGQEHGSELIQFLEEHPSMKPYWKRNGGHDHFMVAGRTGWDFGRSPEDESGWGTGIFHHREFQNVTFLVLEGRGLRPDFEQAVPYPTSFHPPLVKRRGTKQSRHEGASLDLLGKAELREWILKVRKSRRTSLFAFVGAQRPDQAESIRSLLYNQCLLSSTNYNEHSRNTSSSIPPAWTKENETESPRKLLSDRAFHPVCTTLDCARRNCGHNPQWAIDIFLHSEFCLQPRGDTATRRSTFDSIIAGCIPVFFHADSAYTQYKWHLPLIPESYSVYIPEEDIRQGTLVERVLRGYSEEQVVRLRDNLLTLLPRVMYMNLVDGPSSRRCDGSHTKSSYEELGGERMEDAFDISVKGMLEKVRTYIEYSRNLSPCVQSP